MLTDLSALAAAWASWRDRSAVPPALLSLAEGLRDEADRELITSAPGPERARVMGRQLLLALVLDDLGRAARGQQWMNGFLPWKLLIRLAHGTTGAEREEFAALAVRGATVGSPLAPHLLAQVVPLLDPTTARRWMLEALATEGIDTDDQGALLGLLPAEDTATLLPPRIEQAAAIEDPAARTTALLELVAHVPAGWTQRAIAASRARHGVWPPEDESEEAAEEAWSRVEREAWGAPLTAWRLGQQARRLTGSEQGPAFDRALDAFDEIALTPVSPGNDEGPFWAIASWLDEAQVRRALAIVDRMESVDWKGDLGASRCALLTQLARLGHLDEAEALIGRIERTDSLSAHWVGGGWGGVLGARLLHDPAARFAALFARAEEPMFCDPEVCSRMIEALCRVFEGEPRPLDSASTEALLALARTLGPSLGTVALGNLRRRFREALPVSRWVELTLALDGADDRLEGLIDLAEGMSEEGLDLAPVLGPLRALLDGHPDAMSIWSFRDLCDLRSHLAPDMLLAAWPHYLRRASEEGVWRSLDALEDHLAPALVWLAGPGALSAIGRAFAEAASLEPPAAASLEPPAAAP
jgi:hypothetical protein